MVEEFKIIWLLAIGLGFACVLGYISQLLKLPSILGYLLAGYFIGPNSPGFVADISLSEQLASIGVTLLMFTVGLNFNWKDLLAVKKIALPGAIILSSLSIIVGTLYSVYLGESLISGFIIGVAVCVSSTVVMVRVLADQNLLRFRQGQIAIGWTIVEDLISVFGLILLPALVSTTTEKDAQSFVSACYPILLVILKIAILGFFIHFVVEKLIHSILKHIARTRSHELFTIAILACVFFIAIGSSYLFGVSLALGAFIAGTIVGKTDVSHQAAANALPMRDVFAVLFFLSVGMLFNPMAVANNFRLFFGILFLLLVLRPLCAFFMIVIAKYPAAVALTVGLAIAQIGEYSFIVAEEGSRLHILPDNAYDILVACAFITISLNPVLFQVFRFFFSKYFSKSSSGDPFANEPVFNPGAMAKNSKRTFLARAIVVGFGPIGQNVTTYLLQKEYQVVVVDRNIDTISSHKKDSITMLFGDASQAHILEKASIENARLLIITTPDFAITKAIIQTAKNSNPSIQIIARSRFKEALHDHLWKETPIVCDEETSSEKFISLIHKL